jgi:hypothetical protein
MSSNRRILFIAILNFIQSIFLFMPLYRAVPALHDGSYRFLWARSFSTATLFSLSEPITVVDEIQVAFSLFYLVILIAIMASVAYHRQDFSQDNNQG